MAIGHRAPTLTGWMFLRKRTEISWQQVLSNLYLRERIFLNPLKVGLSLEGCLTLSNFKPTWCHLVNHKNPSLISDKQLILRNHAPMSNPDRLVVALRSWVRRCCGSKRDAGWTVSGV